MNEPNSQACYRRVLLKLSGEVLGGERGSGLEPAALAMVCQEVLAAAELGVQLCLVVGGGNILRGGSGTGSTFERTRGDSMGMLATVINALALEDVLQRHGRRARVLTATPMLPIAAPFSASRARTLLDEGWIVLAAGGTGHPYFSTDTAAALRALEIEADALLKGTKVDGVYDRDPKKHAEARRLSRLSHQEAIAQQLQVMDLTALSLCQQHRLPIHVFQLTRPGELERLLRGEAIGSVVSS
ncbi:MAG: UMP kinase [Myxococcota bacterium]|jgi:uridylate kinase|nr:UMP kinase [Myxococcota bacterium]